MRSFPSVLIAVASLALSACAAPQPATAPELDVSAAMVVAGREVARERCASCHGLDAATPSPLAGAPRLSELGGRYDLKILADEFAQGVHVGGGAMPKFALSLSEIDALTAYLESFKTQTAP